MVPGTEFVQRRLELTHGVGIIASDAGLEALDGIPIVDQIVPTRHRSRLIRPQGNLCQRVPVERRSKRRRLMEWPARLIPDGERRLEECLRFGVPLSLSIVRREVVEALRDARVACPQRLLPDSAGLLIQGMGLIEASERVIADCQVVEDDRQMRVVDVDRVALGQQVEEFLLGGGGVSFDRAPDGHKE